MANVDATFDANSPLHAGNHHIVTGTIAITSTAGETRLAPSTGTILYCNLHNEQAPTTGDVQIKGNMEDDMSTASQGLLAHDSEQSTGTFRFVAGVIL